MLKIKDPLFVVKGCCPLIDKIERKRERSFLDVRFFHEKSEILSRIISDDAVQEKTVIPSHSYKLLSSSSRKAARNVSVLGSRSGSSCEDFCTGYRFCQWKAVLRSGARICSSFLGKIKTRSEMLAIGTTITQTKNWLSSR